MTDTVFSMDGTVACLSELCDMAEAFDASIIVDEAHGTGVFGLHGRGVCELQGVEQRIPVRVGTLSKAEDVSADLFPAQRSLGSFCGIERGLSFFPRHFHLPFARRRPSQSGSLERTSSDVSGFTITRVD